ncbi:S-adenosyl-L-methionine-dependent methyltransferase [Halenospora varia]|nr:S-adenosyl-L-methionine-dependent methyltransferase [Halenospora varia]
MADPHYRSIWRSAKLFKELVPATRFNGTAPWRNLFTSTQMQYAKQASKAAKKPQKQLPDYRPSKIKPPPSPSATPFRPKPRPNPLRYRTIPMVFGGATLAGISAYCTILYISLNRPLEHEVPIEAASQADVSKRYDVIANTFDSEVEWTEKIMGIKRLRKKLAKEAHGDVLEISIGTGRNLDFYGFDFKNGKDHGRVKSFTAVDKSEEMLEVAHEKFGRLYPGILGVRWVVADASEEGAIPPPPRNPNERSGNKVGEKYDTIVQTMGLCSVDDPVALLKCLGNIVKEEDGRILLLEHGRGRWQWLNNFLDKSAIGHAKDFGCWWNRDMAKIVGESGLEVVKFDTWHGGTTYWIELRKPKFEKSPIKGLDESKTSKPNIQAKNETRKSWW